MKGYNENLNYTQAATALW